MNRLILLEGIPGTGKTTNSYKLYEQLVRNGRDVRWLHEVSQPHPTLFFSEACLTKEEFRLFIKKYPEVAEILSNIAETRANTVGIDYLTAARRLPGPEIFILLDEAYRNRGYGTKCVRELLRISVEDYALPGVHGGCAKENIASARAMEKGGMVRYGTEEIGDREPNRVF